MDVLQVVWRQSKTRELKFERLFLVDVVQNVMKYNSLSDVFLGGLVLLYASLANIDKIYLI